MNTLQTQIAEIVAEIGEVELLEIEPTTTLRDLGIDSLGYIEIAVHVERKFGLTFSEADLGTIETLDSLVRLVEARRELVGVGAC